nr:DNA directed RNA polymerase beta subunit b [Halimeda borneensis]
MLIKKNSYFEKSISKFHFFKKQEVSNFLFQIYFRNVYCYTIKKKLPNLNRFFGYGTHKGHFNGLTVASASPSGGAFRRLWWSRSLVRLWFEHSGSFEAASYWAARFLTSERFSVLAKPKGKKLDIKVKFLQNFEKSNQNTYFLQRPITYTSQWIQKGDLLSDCSASSKGELALGKNLFVGYMSWEGLNFEDAVLINRQIVSKYLSLHIEKYEIELGETPYGPEKIIRSFDSKKFDKNGIPKIGSWIQEGEILIGKTIPTVPSILLTHEKLLSDVVGSALEETSPLQGQSWTRAKAEGGSSLKWKSNEDKSEVQKKYLTVPSGGRIVRICYTHTNFKKPSFVTESIFGSEGYKIKISKWSQYKDFALQLKFIKRFNILPIICPGARALSAKLRTEVIFQKAYVPLSVAAAGGQRATVLPRAPRAAVVNKGNRTLLNSVKKITIYIAEKRLFKVGDKISGRHGNKGIISQILANCDMPYLPNGHSLDVLLNPLGVPSRMNVGQIFECLLGFAGQIFQTKFQILCFDEIYGYEASRSFIYSKLFESCKKTGQKWLLSKENPGKFHLFDGRSGELFHQSILVGSTYLMKLIHIVDEKIHARATGPYSLITQQPLRGRAKHGGQRFGEMEVWALQGFGIAYAIQELLTVKSDDLQGRNQIMQTLLKNTPFKFGTPESLRVALRELQCLCLCLQLEISK